MGPAEKPATPAAAVTRAALCRVRAPTLRTASAMELARRLGTAVMIISSSVSTHLQVNNSCRACFIIWCHFRFVVLHLLGCIRGRAPLDFHSLRTSQVDQLALCSFDANLTDDTFAANDTFLLLSDSESIRLVNSQDPSQQYSTFTGPFFSNSVTSDYDSV